MNIEKIWLEYQAKLKAFLRKNVSNPADVDDLLQEILIKSYQNFNAVKDTKKVKSWLFQIANNTIIDFYRKRARAFDVTSNDLWYEDGEEEVLSQLSQCVLPFIKGLPDEEANLLIAIEIEGESQKQFSEKNNIKYSTLKSRVQKSRQMLFQLFNNCCELTIDQKGNLSGFQSKGKNCSNC